MKSLLRGSALTLSLAACFGFGFYYKDVANGTTPGTRPINTLLGVQTTSPALSAEAAFRENYARILNNYPRKIDAKELKYSGMEGLVGALGDPHTNFFQPALAKLFKEETQANFFGVGAKLQDDPLGARVATVFEDGPAYRAGLRSGDTITAVDGNSVSGKATDAIVTKVKGPEGTIVRLTVIRPGAEKPLEISIKRARIIAPTVEGKYLKDSGVGYLAISMFSEPTAMQFDAELEKLERNRLKGLVIDLRGNPGGLLSTAAELIGRWVEDETVVKMVFRQEGTSEPATEEQRTVGGTVHNWTYPVVVLMNEESASASEILAGCLRDYGKAKLIGEHSYGKASVQNLFNLRDGASAKVTIAKYLLPKSGDIGRKLDAEGEYVSGGLKPDIEVKAILDGDVPFEFGDPVKDNQLARAIEEVLKG